MTDLYPEIDPYEHGILEVGDGNLVYWEACGNPRGKAAVVLHGGPGSGCSPWWRRLFNPNLYRVVLFDQRGCGRSTPHASAFGTDLANNNTASLIADIELLRQNLRIDRWLVMGASWGSVLALAYAETHPDRVTEMVLFGVSTGVRRQEDWLFRGGMGIFFPEEWERLRTAIPVTRQEDDIVAAYYRLLNDPDPKVRQRAADAWCTWESATPDWPPTGRIQERFTNPTYAMAFARLVTHYVHHHHFLEDGILLRNADALADIPGVIVNGRFDFLGPIGYAWELSRAWPRAELFIVDDAGHSANTNISQEVVRATDQFAAPH
jgi:proline iminopeptidase